MTITVQSQAFEENQKIPKKYTEDGEDVSPEIRWTEIPEGAEELALIMDDPDAPTPEPWVHWVLYKIPSTAGMLPEGVPSDATLTDEPMAGALQGKNSWPTGQTVGYRGPAPPKGHGVHHYHFKLYALDTPLQAQPGWEKATLLKAMEGHILATGELIGTYER
jgi:Raf kinase inhibitor-like YbhB/YbcL family protein